MSEFYIVKVSTPGKKIFFRNRVVRSPVELEMTKDELNIFKMRFDSEATNYSIELSTKEDKLKEEISATPEPLIEELKMKSTLKDFETNSNFGEDNEENSDFSKEC